MWVFDLAADIRRGPTPARRAPGTPTATVVEGSTRNATRRWQQENQVAAGARLTTLRQPGSLSHDHANSAIYTLLRSASPDRDALRMPGQPTNPPPPPDQSWLPPSLMMPRAFQRVRAVTVHPNTALEGGGHAPREQSSHVRQADDADARSPTGPLRPTAVRKAQGRAAAERSHWERLSPRPSMIESA
jgi:hypothetical protein